METPKQKHYPIISALIETFGFSPALATAFTLFMSLLLLGAIWWLVQSAPPRRIVLTSGPEGSTFQRWADAYRDELAKHGVTLEIRPSAGSAENLHRLLSSEERVDLGFVAGGVTDATNLSGLASLGSVAYQPLLIFYRSPSPITRLSELAGQRLAVGAAGSGVRTISLRLLQANGITGSPTTFLDLDSDAAAQALLDKKLDAVFLMGDSASLQTLRTLMRSSEVQLFDFRQADAYVRKFAYLNKIVLPEGAIDLGKNLPTTDVDLVGPTVDLVSHDNLNSAMSDLLIDVAKEVHGKAGLLQKRGEFPAPLEHDELAMSSDALRYYKSGKGFLYRMIKSFWIANLANRLLVVVVPLILLSIPALRLLPLIYQLSVRLRIYRCYRPLLRLERDASVPLDAARVKELLERLAEIEDAANHLKVPASFADQFYELRLHLAFVRQRLNSSVPREI